MITALKDVFGRSARFAILCPLLFAIPVAIEFIQHVAEIHIGLYDSLQAAKALEGHPLRMAVGHLKILSLLLTGYWAIRFLAFGDSKREATRIDRAAVRLYAWVLAWGVLWTLIVQDAPLLAKTFHVAERPVAFAIIALMLFDLAIEIALSGWKAAAPLGNPRVGFLRSLAMIRGSYWWAVGLFILSVLPLLVLHNLLFFVALGKGPLLLWGTMAVDSLVTGYLGVVMVTLTFVIARRMADRHGETLLPAADAAPREG